jgi:hypothetical protein
MDVVRQVLANRHFAIVNSSSEWANVHLARVQTPNFSFVPSVTLLQGFVKLKEWFECLSVYSFTGTSFIDKRDKRSETFDT